MTESRKLGMCEGEFAEAKISDNVAVSSIYLWVGHPGATSSIATRKDTGPKSEPWGIEPFRYRQDDVSF